MAFKPETPLPRKSGENACTVFQPLYHPDNDGEAGDCGSDPAVLLEEAHQKGVHNGRQSGCEEAWAISRSSLRPALRDYDQAIRSLCTLNEQIQENVSGNILELALAIVHQILGDKVSFTPEVISGLKNGFSETLAEVNRFALNLNPDDIDELKAIITADEMAWPDHPGIRINADPSLQPGEILVAEQAPRERLSARIKEGLADLLAQLR